MDSRPIRHTLLGLSFLSLVAAAQGGVALEGKDAKATVTTCPPDTLTWVDLKSSVTFDSDYNRGHNAHGYSWNKEIELEHRIPLHLSDWPNVDCGHWYLRLGADYTRWDFGNSGGLPVPNTLQGISGILALEYVVQDSAVLMLETRPGAYFEHKVRGNSFDAPTLLYAPIYYHQSGDSSFALVAGAYYSDLLKYDVLPAGGFIWRTGKVTARVIVPSPRITYQATDQLAFYVGGEITAGGFSTDTHNVDRKPSLNHAAVQYSEYRAGAGVSYKIHQCTLDVAAGYAFQRKFDFFRAEEGFPTNAGAPYVQVELKTGF